MRFSSSHSIARPGASNPPSSLLARYVILLGVAALVIVADQLSKAIVTNRLETRSPIHLFGGALWILYSRNTGAAFSVLPNGGVLFEIVAVVVAAAILLYYPRLSGGQLLSRVALGLVLGGALGNLIDRVRLGYVVDFIDLRWWPVFNLADSCIVIGVAILLLVGAFDRGGTG